MALFKDGLLNCLDDGDCRCWSTKMPLFIRVVVGAVWSTVITGFIGV